MAAAGLDTAGHPLLGASVALAGSDGYLLTGRLSVDSNPWLGEHVVDGTMLLPGTAFVELAAQAGHHIEELTLEAPLVLPAQGGVQLQLVVGAADDTGRRSVELHAREDGQPWTRHASGTVDDAVPAPDLDLWQWPPAHATAVDIDDLHDHLADLGVHYGPSLRGIEGVWQRDGEMYVQVRLAEDEPGGYDLHPALLDMALQPLGLGTVLPGGGRPFAWRDVALHASGASTLRVRIAATGEETVTVAAADENGAPVATIGTLLVRPAPNPVRRDSLYQFDWVPVTLRPAELDSATFVGADPSGLREALDLPSCPELAALETVPDVVFTALSEPDTGDVAADVHTATHRVLALLQEWLAGERYADSRLVLVTGPATGLVTAPVWGLVRSAQVENPDRFVLLELDDVSHPAVPAALATGEHQLALRDGSAFVPRLARTEPATPRGLDTDGTVLVTGATGALTRLLVRHLVTEHGARRLVLASRRGDADGMAELCDSLDADIRLVACDVTDRAALAAVLADIPDLTAVIHSAAVLDDGVIPSLTPERLDRVLAPKIDGALNLHELTKDRPLTAFVLFSSLSGTLGGAGLGNYSAANAFLDALALHRAEQGLPAVSLAWGLWEQETGMAGRLATVDRNRMSRLGGLLMTAAEGLALFDAAVGAGRPLLAPVKLDLATLRAQAATGELAPLFRGLVTHRKPVVRQRSLTDQLAGKSTEDQERILLELVRGQAAAVLGHTPDAIAPARPFRDIGFDSLTGVELRNRLAAATGLRLPATLVFDHPTPVAIVHRLRTELAPAASGASAVLADLDRLAASLADLTGNEDGVTARLQALLWKWHELGRGDAPADDFEPVTDDEMFDLIDKELGSR